jgi:hypothetical protein
MKANELRVGNWCLSPYEKEPFKIKPEHILHLEQGMDELSILGISLTPEILVKAGFVNGKLNKFYVFGNGNLTVEGYEADYNGLYIGNIKNIYLHQLQNLYFALTGEELTFDL